MRHKTKTKQKQNKGKTPKTELQITNATVRPSRKPLRKYLNLVFTFDKMFFGNFSEVFVKH